MITMGEAVLTSGSKHQVTVVLKCNAVDVTRELRRVNQFFRLEATGGGATKATNNCRYFR